MRIRIKQNDAEHNEQDTFGYHYCSVADPTSHNLDPDPGFLMNPDPDPKENIQHIKH
jgi:hypothetical protein